MKKNLRIQLPKEANKKADTIVDYFLVACFITGLVLAPYYHTWLPAITFGTFCLVTCFSLRLLMPRSGLYQYMLSLVTGVFMVQFVYQMNGLFEMYFLAFIGSAVLVTYRNWKLQIPLGLVVFVHHTAFAYQHFFAEGNTFFTPSQYMSLPVFMMHVGLTLAIFFISGFWAYNIKVSRIKRLAKSLEFEKLKEANKQKDELIAMSESLKKMNDQLKESHLQLEQVFNGVEEVLFSIDRVNNQVIQISFACSHVYGYAPYKFLADAGLLTKVIHLDDRHLIAEVEQKLSRGETANSQYRIIHADNSTRWIEVNIKPTLNTAGILIRTDGLCNDITKKVQLETRLSEERTVRHQQMTAAAITAQEKERLYLSEELHDNVNAILATAKLYIESALTDDENRLDRINESKGFINAAMNEIRSLTRLVAPPSLDDIDLVDAIKDMTDNIGRLNGIKFITSWYNLDENRLSDQLKLAIFRIVQEQLNNISKHAKASEVVISLNDDGCTLKLVIKDNGIGFDTTQKGTGVGLQNIISRTELLSGTIQIISAPGEGCEMILVFNTPHQMTNVSNEIRA